MNFFTGIFQGFWPKIYEHLFYRTRLGDCSCTWLFWVLWYIVVSRNCVFLIDWRGDRSISNPRYKCNRLLIDVSQSPTLNSVDRFPAQNRLWLALDPPPKQWVLSEQETITSFANWQSKGAYTLQKIFHGTEIFSRTACAVRFFLKKKLNCACGPRKIFRFVENFLKCICTLITWLCEINLSSLYKHRVFLVKSTGSLKSTGTKIWRHCSVENFAFEHCQEGVICKIKKYLANI